MLLLVSMQRIGKLEGVSKCYGIIQGIDEIQGCGKMFVEFQILASFWLWVKYAIGSHY
jgi:hypothetical protein